MSEYHPSTWEAKARVAKMDEFGIYSQVLYPNVAGFGAGRFSEMAEPELAQLCLEAYNDFLVDYSNEAPGRFVPIMAVPFWDVELSVREIQRSFEKGHKGIVFTGEPESWGQPPLTARHWDPIWRICEELQIPVNFHIASGQIPVAPGGGGSPEHGVRAAFASGGTNYFMANAAVFGKIIFSGVCHRFPGLNFVSVESGIGWIPFALESMDWQWLNCAVTWEHPEYELLPSEYFARQIYGCFWFERKAALAAIDILGPNNFLYSTDFPHPGNMASGPASAAQDPREYVLAELSGVSDGDMRKILHDNAAGIYHLA
jgi:predicted TIM-barrel fold metal-dependent hydrolase